MPYILSPIIKETLEGMWFEGAPYRKEAIYDIHSTDPKAPPVNYSAYTLKPHSLPHIEGAAHTMKEGDTVDKYFSATKLRCFWGRALVVKLKGARFVQQVCEVTLEELKRGIWEASGSHDIPDRLLLTLEDVPLTIDGRHDPNFIMILSQQAADYLLTNKNFGLYGTSWKSSDYRPGSRERPIHNTLFKQAVIMECLNLKEVPKGSYFLNAFPIPLEGASESPVCPVLFTQEEILNS
jgi:arylformamidase